MATLQALRKSTGLSQTELAGILQTHQAVVSLWERGKRMPRADKLAPIAAALSCSTDDLLHALVEHKSA
jgi:transcriptional regulator with XRE-family HTH domain